MIGYDGWSDEVDFGVSDSPPKGSQAKGVDVTGICGSGIIEVVAEMYLSGIVDEDGVIRSQGAKPSDRIVADGRTWAYVLHRGDIEVRITQNDIRAIQLAKAALYAGVRLLMDRLGVEADRSHSLGRGPSAAISMSNTRSCSVWCPIAPSIM